LVCSAGRCPTTILLCSIAKMTTTAILSTSKEVQLRSLLNELTFWEPSPRTTETRDGKRGRKKQGRQSSSSSKSEQQLQPQTKKLDDSSAPHETSARSSPPKTLQELEAACTWQKTVDPSSGRTYYYDTITRQSQWEKVRMYACREEMVYSCHAFLLATMLLLRLPRVFILLSSNPYFFLVSRPLSLCFLFVLSHTTHDRRTAPRNPCH